jgi:predicted ribosome quality control (RQC) complex YloA/Tae2 family protein
MTRVTLDLAKSIEENASQYYEKAKKLKKKLEGTKGALEKLNKQLNEIMRKSIVKREEKPSKAERKKEWYEKFRWFISSEGFLVIGGRDATSNEIVIKKHTDKNDVVFHTDMAGSPFFVVKTEGKKPGEKTLLEAADATCSYGKAWKLGMTTTSVFYVKPEQVSKKTKAGEYMGKGAFMIYGKVNYIENKINLAVGIKDGFIMGGPLEAVKKNCEEYVEVEPGKEKTSAVAKRIQKKIGGDLDEIIRVLPAGGCKVK